MVPRRHAGGALWYALRPAAAAEARAVRADARAGGGQSPAPDAARRGCARRHGRHRAILAMRRIARNARIEAALGLAIALSWVRSGRDSRSAHGDCVAVPVHDRCPARRLDSRGRRIAVGRRCWRRLAVRAARRAGESWFRERCRERCGDRPCAAIWSRCALTRRPMRNHRSATRQRRLQQAPSFTCPTAPPAMALTVTATAHSRRCCQYGRRTSLPGHVAHHRPGETYWWLTHGIAGTPMPGFADRLTQTQRWQLVNFLRARADAEEARKLTGIVGAGGRSSRLISRSRLWAATRKRSRNSAATTRCCSCCTRYRLRSRASPRSQTRRRAFRGLGFVSSRCHAPTPHRRRRKRTASIDDARRGRRERD